MLPIGFIPIIMGTISGKVSKSFEKIVHGKGGIALYPSLGGKAELNVRLKGAPLWPSLNQIGRAFRTGQIGHFQALEVCIYKR